MADAAVRPARLLHLHSSFSLGGKEARAIRLMNVWGDRARHSIVSGVPGDMGARAAIDAAVAVDYPADVPLIGPMRLSRLRAIATFMAEYDLILSYNWGAMDGVVAHRLFKRSLNLPPLIHHEDGFNIDEVDRLKTRRNLYRRFGLARVHALVVPSVVLEGIALRAWRQPTSRLRLIRNGIDVDHYAMQPAPDAIPGLVRSRGKLIVGTLAGLRPVKNIRRLVRAVAQHKHRLQLVVVGEGEERDSIMREARALGLDDLHMAGFMADPWRFVGVFDIFALSSDSEQFPISLVEAMAAGLPVASTDVGDVANMVATENRPFIVSGADGLADALGRLAADEGLRRHLGAANRARAERDFTERAMVDAYARLYGEALARPDIFR
ncbi:glycosyltransferase involved in cell wall biosynthesis [Sphingobium fontiphilum]|uniref:Glycosyltransferase involved in cell wall biosynthesis n=1 Tax=Sphingobium fontiphilum TaxID=944425 RepID=A0A7W6DL39_9SPHN|nr:glycosyltransferase [Sphingobium fontiphilum]MBB3981014.1 glycosyltransferase involved in cell wall biosynthesis [Sphingobium fontiphilum]